MIILKIVILPIYKHEVYFHLFVSSSISFISLIIFWVQDFYLLGWSYARIFYPFWCNYKSDYFLNFSFDTLLSVYAASLVAQMVKHLPAMWETRVQSLGWKDPLEKEMATYSSTLDWKIPWMEEPGRLQSMELQRVRHNTEVRDFTISI